MEDRTPSQLLRHLQTLSDKNAQDKLLRTLWVDKLPPQLQTVVAHHPDLALADVAIGRQRARRAQDAAADVRRNKRSFQHDQLDV
jgi:hypothetical protein